MKKNLFALLSIATIIIAWCTDSDAVKIDAENRASDEWSSVEQVFKKQIDETQYIKDLEDFLSYDVFLSTENIPFVSKFSFEADFDGKSTVQWWFGFSQKKILKSEDLESMDIEFNLEATEDQNNAEPIYSSWDVTLLYQNDKMYANVHDFWLFMWEWNMTAKMYELLWGMVKDKWVDLEVNENWWIISVNNDDSKKIPYVMWTLKNILTTDDVQSSPNFLNSIAEMIDTINSYADLWISTNELKLLTQKIEYSQLADESIQKEFIGSFQWSQSAFDLSFITSKKWLEVHVYNIKDYDEDLQNYKDTESEIFLSLQENKKSNYSVVLQSTKYHQKVIDIDWKIKYSKTAEFSADFVLEPTEMAAWQKFSWKLKWNIEKNNLGYDEEFPELTWQIMSFNEILSSL